MLARELPLPAGTARKLWATRPPHDEGPMFVTRNGTRFIDRNVRRVLDSAAKSAGCERVTFRHTCASMLFDGGKNIKQASEWLGHADAAFTLRTYVHLMDAGLGDADFLDAAVGNPWATQAPKTAANASRTPHADSASSSRNDDQPQVAVNA